MASSDETSTYTCTECDKGFTGLSAWWRHQDEAHPVDFYLQVADERQQYSHRPRFNPDGDMICPICKHDEVSTWADDGEADLADWWQCEKFSGGCGAHGALMQAVTRRAGEKQILIQSSVRKTPNGLPIPA